MASTGNAAKGLCCIGYFTDRIVESMICPFQFAWQCIVLQMPVHVAAYSTSLDSMSTPMTFFSLALSATHLKRINMEKWYWFFDCCFILVLWKLREISTWLVVVLQVNGFSQVGIFALFCCCMCASQWQLVGDMWHIRPLFQCLSH